MVSLMIIRIKAFESDGYDIVEIQFMTDGVTSHVTQGVTQKRNKTKKEENPPHPLKKKKTKIRKNNSHKRVRAREKLKIDVPVTTKNPLERRHAGEYLEITVHDIPSGP